MRATLRAEERGTEYPFTVFRKDDHKVLGSTRYMDVRPLQRGVEIGWTWYTSRVWGTVVNPECKFLMLRHAFEDWNAVRVQLKTDNNNVHSQNAILKLGAKFEGGLRNHRIRRDGIDGRQHDVLDHRRRMERQHQEFATAEDREPEPRRIESSA